MNQIMQNAPMTVFGDGTQSRAFSYIDDVAPFIARSVTVPAAYNQVINIGADKPYAVNQLVHVVADALGARPEVRYLAARKEIGAAYRDVVGRVFPAMTAVQVAELIEDAALVEIEVTAVVPD